MQVLQHRYFQVSVSMAGNNSSSVPYQHLHQQLLQATRGERNVQLPSYKETSWKPAQFKPPPAPPSLPHPLQQQRQFPSGGGREDLSRDSGVHTDNEPLHHTTTTTLPHLPTHSHGQTTVKQRTITELAADRSQFNPVLRRKSTLLSAGEKSQELIGERKRGRRKLWEDDEEQTASVRASWMKPPHPISPSKPPAVDKTAAAQYYLTRARYSTSGKHKSNQVVA